MRKYRTNDRYFLQMIPAKRCRVHESVNNNIFYLTSYEPTETINEMFVEGNKDRALYYLQPNYLCLK